MIMVAFLSKKNVRMYTLKNNRINNKIIPPFFIHHLHPYFVSLTRHCDKTTLKLSPVIFNINFRLYIWIYLNKIYYLIT